MESATRHNTAYKSIKASLASLQPEFHPTDIEYLRLELWLWCKAVTSTSPFTFKGYPSDVLHLRDQVQSLLYVSHEAFKVIHFTEEDRSSLLLPPFSEERIQAERAFVKDLNDVAKTYNGAVRRLTAEEIAEPVLFLQRLFAFSNLEKWEDMLEEWVEYGLSRDGIFDGASNGNELECLELLEGMLEMFYLIHLSEKPQPEDTAQPEMDNARQKAAEEENGELSAAIRLLIMAVAPEMIFRVDHPALSRRNKTRYTDLLVVIPDTVQTPFTELEPLADFALLRESRLSCSLHKSIQVAQCLEKGHLYYSLVCTQANLIYSNGTGSLPLTSIFAEVVDKAKAFFSEGFHMALGFYKSAQFHYQREDRNMAAFMLQQATELTFRTMSRTLYGSEKKTHYLHSLLHYNRRLAPQLNEIFPNDTEEGRRLVKLLDDAYLNTRYYTGFDISPEDLRILMGRVGKLQARARKVFSLRIESLLRQNPSVRNE